MTVHGTIGAVAGIALILSAACTAAAGEPELLPFPERLDPVQPPVNVAVRYRAIKPAPYRVTLRWGPERTPELYRLDVSGTVEIQPGQGGPAMLIERTPTQFMAGPNRSERRDGGRIVAALSPRGELRRVEIKLPGLDSNDHRRQFEDIGRTLIDTGFFPTFRRLLVRAGPEDAGGDAQSTRERAARGDLVEAFQPLLGLAIGYPEEGLFTGQRLVLIRRDLGDLFRGAGPIPVTVSGEIKGLADAGGRRVLALRIDKGEAPRPLRLNAAGYALIDIENGLVTSLSADLELVVLHGTEASVFRFAERRALGRP